MRCLPFCVNALHRASPISTWLRTSIIRILAILVSMPYIGLLPFLLLRFLKEEEEKPTCVNALHRASPISTDCKSCKRKKTRSVSMPYIGLLPFLQKGQKIVSEVKVVCQCPTSGFSHFYTRCVSGNRQKESVSMPYIGLLPFLQYPLKNLIKSMVSGTVFRG